MALTLTRRRFAVNGLRPARAQEFRRVFTAAETAEPIGERMRGWYSYPGAAQAGFLIIEASSHEELARLLGPYTELMAFDVKPIVSVDYQQRWKQLVG